MKAVKDLKTAEQIYNAGAYWEKFDFKKGLDALIKKDKIGKYIYFAGNFWKQFDFSKGFDALIKIDKVGDYIYSAGCEWDKFDFKKGLDVLIKVDKKGKSIFYAGLHWKKFDCDKGLEVLKELKDSAYYKKALENWPKGIKQSQEISKLMSKSAKKLPKKTLKLENIIDDAEAQKIYNFGLKYKNFDFKRGFDELVKADKREGFWTYHAGKYWEKFDYKKGLDTLIKMDKHGRWIYDAGCEWKKFGYEKGLRALKALKSTNWYEFALEDWPMGIKQSKEISKDIKSKAKKLPKKTLKLEDVDIASVYDAGLHRPNFNFKKGLDDLIRLDNSGEYIWRAGWIWKEFDFNKGFNALVKKTITGKFIYYAGSDWKKFDYVKGLKVLRDISSYYYRRALKNWPKGIKQSLAKSKRISKAAKKLPRKILKLESVDDWKNAQDIYFAGKYWKKFDYDKGLDDLIKVDKNGYHIYGAGTEWKKFDYKKGLKALKNTNNYYYKLAKTEWPKDIQQSQTISKKIRDTAKKLPKKTLRLESFIEEINNEIY